MSHDKKPSGRLSRRAFTQGGSLVILGAGLAGSLGGRLWAEEPQAGEIVLPERGAVRVGLVTDLHYADKAAAGSRHYRETLEKFAEAAQAFEHAEVDFVVSLGDLIDSAPTVEAERGYLTRIAAEFAALPCESHFVLGNHCVESLTKEEYLGEIGQAESWYSFDRGGVRFVLLDACFNVTGAAYGRKNSAWNDANLPREQLEWLAADLAQAEGPAVVMIHQRLDDAGDFTVRNAAAVRAILEEAGNVQLVLQGHSHANALVWVGDIPYCVLAAMIEGSGVESNGYSVMDCYADGTLRLSGFRRQEDRAWG